MYLDVLSSLSTYQSREIEDIFNLKGLGRLRYVWNGGAINEYDSELSIK